MLFTGLGRSVLGETVLSVKTSGTVSSNTDLPAGFIYFVYSTLPFDWESSAHAYYTTGL